MNRLFAALPVAIAALAAAGATPAAAQQFGPGTYTGVATDGSGVQLTVGTDASTGNPAITSASIGFNATCSGGAPNLDTGWGYGLTQDIVNHRAMNTTYGSYFTIKFSVAFTTSGATYATGRVSAMSPSLEPVGPMPKKAAFCRSMSQPFTLTGYTAPPPAGARVGPPATGAVSLDKLHSLPNAQF